MGVADDRWLDGSLRPIWQQTFPATYREAELNAAFDALDAVVADAAQRREPLSVLVDTSQVREGNSANRRRIVQSFARTTQIASGCVVGQAFVMRTSMQRGALTAIFWFVRPAWPTATFETRAAALAWLQALHDKRGPQV